MKRCRFSPKGGRGAHDLAVICSQDDDNPVLMACLRCGDAIRHEVTVHPAIAADDIPSDLIAKLSRRNR